MRENSAQRPVPRQRSLPGPPLPQKHRTTVMHCRPLYFLAVRMLGHRSSTISATKPRLTIQQAVRPGTALQLRLCRSACVHRCTSSAPLQVITPVRNTKKEVSGVSTRPREPHVLAATRLATAGRDNQVGVHRTFARRPGRCCYSLPQAKRCVWHDGGRHVFVPCILRRPTAIRSGKRPVFLAFQSITTRIHTLLPLPTVHWKT